MVKNIWSKIAYYWFIAMLIISGFLLGNNLNASAISSYSVYNGYSTISGCGDSGKYNYDTLGPNLQGAVYYNIGNVGSTINGQAKNMLFGFKHDLQANKTYDLIVTFKSKDLTNKLTSSKIFVYNGTNCGDMTNNNIAILSVTNKASSGSNANKIKIRLYSNIIIPNWVLEFRGGNKAFTSVNNFGISSFDLVEVDTSNNNQVIENNNQNTDNIINNQNENTQQIIDSQNELLGNKCENLFNTNLIKLNDTNMSGNNKSFTLSGSGYGGLDINLEKGTYYINSKGLTNNVDIYINGNYVTSNKLNNYSFTLNSNGTLGIVLYSNTYTNFSIFKDKNKSYCEYGTNISKIDETNNSINNLNDTMKDDSIDNPNSFIEDMEDLLPHNGVITQLLTLPISLFQKVLTSINGTCQSFNLGNLYGTNLIMGCVEPENYLGSTLWNLIDLIISGVFVLTIARKMIKAFEGFTGMKEGDVIND